MKKCPYCAEEIQDEAIYCRFCKNDLIQPTSISQIPLPTHIQKAPNKNKAVKVILMIVLVSLVLCFIITIISIIYGEHDKPSSGLSSLIRNEAQSETRIPTAPITLTFEANSTLLPVYSDLNKQYPAIIPYLYATILINKKNMVEIQPSIKKQIFNLMLL